MPLTSSLAIDFSKNDGNPPSLNTVVDTSIAVANDTVGAAGTMRLAIGIA